jgi:hypothetical protein
VDRLTRKELKSDRFALEVQHSIQVVSDHRQQLTRWGTIAGVVAILVIAVVVYRNHEHVVRQEALHAAQQLQNASIGPQQNELSVSFPTQAERECPSVASPQAKLRTAAASSSNTSNTV